MMNPAGLLSVAVALPPTLALLHYAREVVAGLRTPHPLPAATATPPRIALIMPAHDERGGIGATLDALRTVAPPGLSILVVADNCRDDTAAVARAHGAEVVERHDTTRIGKGYALAHGRDHLANDPPDVVLILDADCRFAPGSIARLAAVAQATGAPAQAINTLAPDRNAPPLVQISSFAMLVKNAVRAPGMVRLGGTALLTGTGMAFPWARIADAPLATGNIVEDLALGIGLARAGHPVRLVDDAFVLSPAARKEDTLAQRARWERGFLATSRELAWPTLRSGLQRGSRMEALLGMHLMIPPLALLFALAGVLFGLLLLVAWLMPEAQAGAWVLGVAIAIASAATVAAWWRRGRSTMTGAALLQAPLYVLWKLPLYLAKARPQRWVRARRDHDA